MYLIATMYGWNLNVNIAVVLQCSVFFLNIYYVNLFDVFERGLYSIRIIRIKN